MNHLISIIIPIYNAEIYLEECINSIIKQTYTNWELILVNDGSTDNSELICKKFSTQNNKIHYFSKKNEGVSIARNYGITKAKGKWITFIDSDDYIEEDYLHQFSSENNCDMIIGGYNIFGIENKTINPESFKIITIQPDNFIYIDVPESNPNINILYHICGKFFRKEFINKYKIIFEEHMKLAEDTCFNIEYLSYCNNICIIPYAGYYYRKNNYAKKRTMDYQTYRTHLFLFDNSVNNLYQRKNYRLKSIYNSINKAIFEALNEYLYLNANNSQFIDISNKITKNNSLYFHQVYPNAHIKRILLKTCYTYPSIGYYLFKIIYNIKRTII